MTFQGVGSAALTTILYLTTVEVLRMANTEMTVSVSAGSTECKAATRISGELNATLSDFVFFL